ncbi:MAG: hypothetical protein WA173_14245 [Pseudomonas sp.]|uniref:hypothetical protein n=1 Tax=Pseudomonas sp. TaxID=306 RepID=UPI003BB4A7D4
MTTKTFIPAQYNSNTLADLIAEAIQWIDKIEHVTTFGILQLLAEYDERKTRNQTVNTEIQNIPFAQGTMSEVLVVWNKSPDEIAELVKEATERATAEYLADLESQKQEAITVMANQMVNQKREKRLKELADIDAVELAEATAHAVKVMEEAKTQAAKLLAKQTAKLNKDVI